MSYRNTTVSIDFDKWIDEKTQPLREEDNNFNGSWKRDFEGLYYLDKNCHLAGFMRGPVATWKNIHFSAITVPIDDLDEFVQYCDNYIGERHIFLYDLHYNIGMPYYGLPDPVTFEPAYNTKPVPHTSQYWKVRYGECPIVA